MNTSVADIVIASQDAVIERNVDRYASFLAEDVVIDDPTMPQLVGRDAARKFVEGIVATCPEIAFADRKVFVSGRTAAMRFTLRFRTTSGKEALVEGVDVFEVNEAGLIQHLKSYYDPGPFAALMAG
ncbi:MAG TPA: nuclear transport factor 2 family protein [Polyangiaceae bacterium]|jgi:ketosteroid isomerase-like protein|nr:nuclear transport factor 2 family protein [Polyangiaceae bacterium]